MAVNLIARVENFDEIRSMTTKKGVARRARALIRTQARTHTVAQSRTDARTHTQTQMLSRSVARRTLCQSADRQRAPLCARPSLRLQLRYAHSTAHTHTQTAPLCEARLRGGGTSAPTSERASDRLRVERRNCLHAARWAAPRRVQAICAARAARCGARPNEEERLGPALRNGRARASSLASVPICAPHTRHWYVLRSWRASARRFSSFLFSLVAPNLNRTLTNARRPKRSAAA